MNAVPASATLYSIFLALSLGTATVPFAGCGEDSEPKSFQRDAGTNRFDGVYRVSGTTIEIQTGISREISGLLVLRQEGNRYTTNFDLGTNFHSDDDDSERGRSVEVIGEGSGQVIGDVLRGSAHTQLIAAAIPGIDVRFALLPRMVSARLVSTTEAKLRADDSIEVAIESRTTEEGQHYIPTRTTLIGVRVGGVGEVPALPDVAAGR